MDTSTTATTVSSLPKMPFSTIALMTCRPIRPNPLIATFSMFDPFVRVGARPQRHCGPPFDPRAPEGPSWSLGGPYLTLANARKQHTLAQGL